MKTKQRKTDIEFAKYIKKRDGFTCQRCRKPHPNGGRGLHVSHYWGRSRENTRFDPENCIALCFGCHLLWGHGDQRGDYMKYMLDKLGQKGYDLLEVRAHTYKRRDDVLDMIGIKALEEL